MGGWAGGGEEGGSKSGTERHEAEADYEQQTSASFAWIFDPLFEDPR